MCTLLIIQFAHLFHSCVQFQYFQYAHTHLILITYLLPCRKDNRIKRKTFGSIIDTEIQKLLVLTSRTRTECNLSNFSWCNMWMHAETARNNFSMTDLL